MQPDDEVIDQQKKHCAKKMGMSMDMYNSFINNMHREKKPNNTNKKIDFNEEMSAFKRRTEKELPFTMT